MLGLVEWGRIARARPLSSTWPVKLPFCSYSAPVGPMLTQRGPNPGKNLFSPSLRPECFHPSRIALARKVGVTGPQAMRCASRRALGSSAYASSAAPLAPGSSGTRPMIGVSSSGLSCAWTHLGDARASTAMEKGRADSRQRIVLILGLVVGEFRAPGAPPALGSTA